MVYLLFEEVSENLHSRICGILEVLQPISTASPNWVDKSKLLDGEAIRLGRPESQS